MADFEMRNFHHFPMEKCSYDLKLELLEELDPDEAMELMKANNGFRSIYLKDPWRLIGRHVYRIYYFGSNTITIWKLRRSAALPCDSRFHMPLLKKIKSCTRFDYTPDRRLQRTIDTARKMLSNFDLIGNWEYWISDLESYKECFSYFKGQITDVIGIDLAWYSAEEKNDPALSVISEVFRIQLGKCKKVEAYCCVDQFSIIDKLFSKTKIEIISCDFVEKQFTLSGLEKAIRWIVCNGIPSQNREAKIRISFSVDFPDDFLSAFPGMQKMPDEMDMRSYRRKIDGERDCFYELQRKEPYSFSAEYVASEAQ